jgi:hypothetical protein
VNRSISATALAALFVLTAQAAFADTSSDSAKIAASGATAAVAAAPTTASVSMPATARVRSAARIPGTFAITAPSNQDAIELQFQLHAMLPALSGNA